MAGRNEATVEAFFDALGNERAAHIRLVSTDAGSWITNVADRRAPNAVRLPTDYLGTLTRGPTPN